MLFTKSGRFTRTESLAESGRKSSIPRACILAAIPFGVLTLGGLCLNNLPTTQAAYPTAITSSATILGVQETGTQDDDDQDAPPPRPGRKKFQDAPKRGKVVPDAPNAPMPPGAFGQMFGGPGFGGRAFGGPGFGGPAFPGQMQMTNARGNQSVSRSNINGNVTTTVQKGDRKIQVEEGRQGVFVSLVRTYHRSDLPELEESNPKLAEALKAFPDDMDGEMLDVTVTSTKKYEATSVEALEKDQPEGYKLYEEAMEAFEANGGMNFGNAAGMMPPGFSPFTEAQLQQMQQMEQEMQRAQQRMQQQLQQNGFGFQFGN